MSEIPENVCVVSLCDILSFGLFEILHSFWKAAGTDDVI